MPDLSELSERECEILRLVATGASNKEIAQQLTISPNTVKVHLKKIFSKIGVASRTEAAMAAVNLGLVQTAAAINGSVLVAGDNGPLNRKGQATSRQSPAARWRTYAVLGAVAVLLLFGSVSLLVMTGRLSPTNVLASPSPPIEPPRWQAKADLPTPRSGLAVAAFDGRVFAIGGETGLGTTGKIEVYDPEANRWAELSSKPIPVADISAAVIGGLIYLPGGRLSSGGLTAALEVYDPDEDRWEKRASLPTALSAYALTAFEGRLYLFGGWDGQRYLDSVYEYDPGQDAWQKKSPMPTPRAFAGAAVAAGRIYVIGGWDGEQILAVNEAYLPSRDHEGDTPWLKVRAMPAGRYGIGIASLADIIHIIGGEGAENASLAPIKYFPQHDNWQVLENENIEQMKAWSHLQLAPVGTDIYALGGQQEGEPSTQNMSYQAIYTVVIPIIR